MENTDKANTNVEGKGAEETPETLNLTQEELQLMLQKESDKRVSSALEKARGKWEAEIGNKMDSHLKDYERKAQMTPEQLKQMDIEEKFAILEKKERQYEQMTRKVEINSLLSNKGLSTVLTDFVYDDDMGVVEQKVATLEQLVLGMVNEQVEKRINTSKPRASVKTDGLDKESFSKLSLEQRSELYRTNPELYKQLSN